MRTGQLYRLDMADTALKEAGIPHLIREETFSGLQTAVPAAPSMGPGIWWSVQVPVEATEQGRLVLAELPFEITLKPDVWDCGSVIKEGRIASAILSVWAIALVVVLFCGCVIAVIRAS